MRSQLCCPDPERLLSTKPLSSSSLNHPRDARVYMYSHKKKKPTVPIDPRLTASTGLCKSAIYIRTRRHPRPSLSQHHKRASDTADARTAAYNSPTRADLISHSITILFTAALLRFFRGSRSNPGRGPRRQLQTRCGFCCFCVDKCIFLSAPLAHLLEEDTYSSRRWFRVCVCVCKGCGGGGRRRLASDLDGYVPIN